MRRPKSKSAGQALIETILMLPIIVTIVLNAINFGYFFLMALNITASARSTGLYSITGDETPAAIAVPPAGPSNAPGSVSSGLLTFSRHLEFRNRESENELHYLRFGR
jgi:hypothetical protein